MSEAKGNTPQKPYGKRINIDGVRVDGGTQIREALDQETVNRYAEALENGEKLPRPLVFFDGTYYWLADGFHRLAAHRKLKKTAIVVDSIRGTKEDALWYATEANAKHGLPLSRADKRHAIEAVLRHPNGQSLSNVQVAKRVGTSDKTVQSVREQLESTSEIPKLVQRIGADGKVRKVKPKKKVTPEPDDTEEAVPQDKTGDPDRDGFELVENGLVHQDGDPEQGVLDNLPELSPDVMLQGIGGNQDRLVEIHPCPERSGYYYMIVYHFVNTDGESLVEYDKRPGRYTREMLATSLKEVHQVKPSTWRAIPATGVVPWPVLSHDEQAS